MRHLFYTNYESGHSGLSNGIMSIEIGVVMAFLTNRMLLLDGNVSPPANVVSYGGRVNNDKPTKITDLIDLPLPWNDPRAVDISALRSRELTDHSLMNSTFYLPGSVDITSPDAEAFARGRKNWLCETEELAEVPVLRVSEKPTPPGEARHRTNLGFYSYFFYLDNETRRSVYQVLKRMQPKSPYADLARKVAADLGRFNAVHMRRGDFKVTYGVTVLDRQPWEAIDAMQKHFETDKRLLICTDERDDPFFDELKGVWTDHVFIDHHILDNYEKEFQALPHHDSITLAYLSQLVAAESDDFIGTMTSTFTSMIQRYRGNNGKSEAFKFLWNELPDPGDRFERGRHPISECVPLDDGIMVEEFDGPYTWNRVSPLLNPSWMREWPESFLTESVLETGDFTASSVQGSASAQAGARLTSTTLIFEGLRVRFNSTIPGLAFKLSEMFHKGDRDQVGSVFAVFEISEVEGRYDVTVRGSSCGVADHLTEIPDILIKTLVPMLTNARKFHSWLNGMVFKKDGRTIIYAGELGGPDDSVADALCSSGWEMLADKAIPIRSKSCEIVPFARCTWPKGAASRLDQSEEQVTAVVYATQSLHERDALMELSPAVGAAELIRESIDFQFDRDLAVKRLCKVVEQVPVFGLSFSRSVNVPEKLEFLAHYDRPPKNTEVQKPGPEKTKAKKPSTKKTRAKKTGSKKTNPKKANPEKANPEKANIKKSKIKTGAKA
jgi:hypothetical protein